MSFESVRSQIQQLMDDDYALFVMGLLSIELDITDEDLLEAMYTEYMDSDMSLINDSF